MRCPDPGASVSLGVIVTGVVCGGAAGAAGALPRISVRDGAFVDEANRPFRPRGFNYIRLRKAPHLWHDTFNPAGYDGPRAGEALSDMARRGFNTVRVFVDHSAGEGAVASEDASGLSERYMANFVDFLGRARASGVHVIAAMCYLPPSPRYRRIAGPHPAGVGGANAMFLSPGHVEAKATYIADFVAAVAERDGSLLSTVFSYELDNETHLAADQPPFSLKKGSFEFGGRSYRLDSDDDLQRLADDGVASAANAAVRAVRRVDPRAMVSVNVFTFAAVGRSGPGRLLTDKTGDARFPARPLALAGTEVPYLDIHLYKIDAAGLERDLKSVEWDGLAPALREAGKPIIMGEFGAFKSGVKTADAATGLLVSHVDRVLDRGFAGHLMWTYDSDMQRDIWNARMEGGTILEALTRAEALR